MKSGRTPRLRITEYLRTTKLTPTQVAAKTGFSRQRIDKWVKLNSPFFIYYKDIPTMETIIRVKHKPPSKVIYERSA